MEHDHQAITACCEPLRQRCQRLRCGVRLAKRKRDETEDPEVAHREELVACLLAPCPSALGCRPRLLHASARGLDERHLEEALPRDNPKLLGELIALRRVPCSLIEPPGAALELRQMTEEERTDLVVTTVTRDPFCVREPHTRSIEIVLQHQQPESVDRRRARVEPQVSRLPLEPNRLLEQAGGHSA